MAELPALAWRTTMKRRLLLAAAVLAMWTAAVEARLVYLQIVQHDQWVAVAAKQQSDPQLVPGRRGDIVDRRGEPLALTAEAHTIAANPKKVADPVAFVSALCTVLRDCSGAAREQYVTRLSDKSKPYASLRRQIPPEQAARVAALKLEGLYFQMEPKRFYPNGTLAAHALGFVDRDLKGLSGVERRFQDDISGSQGLVLVHYDGGRTRSEFAQDVLTPPTAGASIELTLDKYVQHVAERELKRALKDHGAEAGTVVVMDPWTNEVLAFANAPTFDPNAPGDATPEALVNRGVEYVYEPGSTLKLVTASAALEHDIFTSDEIIDVSAGEIRFGRDVIKDDHKSGPLSFADVIAHSSNVGAVKVAQRLGAERLVQSLLTFGFGRQLAPDFKGESAGHVWPAARLAARPSELARVSMGYQINVTAVQMAAALSSIANGGELLQPRLVRAFIKDGKRHETPRLVLNRTVSAGTAAEMTAIMERVVTDGTGTAAQVPGYTVAGKTGTAQKLIDKIYSNTHYFASFVGFVPSRNPKYAIVVVIDSPLKGSYYGGTVAAPVFRRIAEDVLRYAGVPPTLNAPPPVLVRRDAQAHEVRTSGRSIPSVAAPAGVSSSTIPDFTGASSREALVTLARLGMTPKVRGSGLVVDQRPAPGAPLEPGGVATLWLDRKPAVPRAPASSPR